MNYLKIIIFAFVACDSFSVLSQQSIIVLYGCSSSGKTSIATELLKTLPDNWKYIASNQFRVARKNKLLWDAINDTTQKGFNVIVDTHDFKFFIDPSQDLKIVTVLLYCSPEKLIEHVYKRNHEDNKKNHRELKTVFNEFCNKYKPVKKNQSHIDTLNKETLQKSYGFFITLALKKIMNQFFQNDQNIVHIAPIFKNYDCFINTGKLSITQSAQKIISFLKN